MAFTQAQLDALDKALGEGALVVKYEDKQIEYRSLDEMMRLRNTMRRELSGATGGSSLGGTRIHASYSGGASHE